MGFYFRKSFGSGPFRINFSKSGISYSAGIKGARVNFSNRGTYVNFGSHGIYYRKKISDFGQKGYTQNPTNYTPVTYEQHTITSSNVEEITDTDSQDFINELTEKGKKISYYNWFGIFPLLLSAIILFYTFFSSDSNITNHQVTETKDFIKSLSTSNTNIRQSPYKTSNILGVINPGEQFELVDESQTDWYKINLNGQDGFVSKKFSEKTTATSTNEEPTTTSNPNLFDRQPSLFLILFVSLTIFFSILLYNLKKIDNKRLLVEIYYDLDDRIKEVYEKFVYHFSELLNCAKVWQYLHSERTYNYKYSSGAAHTITRKPLSKISTNKAPSKIFRTNVEIPFLGLINTELYFFPERLIIKRGNEFGAIMYKNIECFEETARFIESQGVPRDSVVVGQTWRYLNKNGTPDRRFNNNYKIPICQYSEYSFKSNSGLNEKISTSKVGGFDEFIRYIKAIGRLQKNLPSDIISEERNNSKDNDNKAHLLILSSSFSKRVFESLIEYSKSLVAITDKLKDDKTLCENILPALKDTTANEFIPFCVLFDLAQIVKAIGGEIIDSKKLNIFSLSLIAPEILPQLGFNPLNLDYETINQKYLSNALTEYIKSLIELVNKDNPLKIDIDDTENGKVISSQRLQNRLSIAAALKAIEHPLFTEYANVLYRFAHIIENDKELLEKVYQITHNPIGKS